MKKIACSLIILLLLTSSLMADDNGEVEFVYLYDNLNTSFTRVFFDGRQEMFDLGLDTENYLMIGTESMIFTDDGRRVAYCRRTLTDRLTLQLVMRDIEAESDLFVTEVDTTGNNYCQSLMSWFNEDETMLSLAILPRDMDFESQTPPIGRLLTIDVSHGAIVTSLEGWESNDRYVPGMRYHHVLPTLQEAVWTDFDPTQAFSPEFVFSNVIMYARNDEEPYRIFVVPPTEEIIDMRFIEDGERLAVRIRESGYHNVQSHWRVLDRQGVTERLDVPPLNNVYSLRSMPDGYILFNLLDYIDETGTSVAMLYHWIDGQSVRLIAEITFDTPSVRLVWIPTIKPDEDLPPFPFADWFAPGDEDQAPGWG